MDLFNQPFEVHTRENNPDSSRSLDEHLEGFGDSCRLVYNALMSGQHLTVRGAMLSEISAHLPRRIKDLRDKNGILISDENIGQGRKAYYMTPEQMAMNKVKMEGAK
jgi:hypothetical protein